MECLKLVRNLTLVVFAKLENSRVVGGKSDSHNIVFWSLRRCFVLLLSSALNSRSRRHFFFFLLFPCHPWATVDPRVENHCPRRAALGRVESGCRPVDVWGSWGTIKERSARVTSRFNCRPRVLIDRTENNYWTLARHRRTRCEPAERVYN